jgi:hypothetical protein
MAEYVSALPLSNKEKAWKNPSNKKFMTILEIKKKCNYSEDER